MKLKMLATCLIEKEVDSITPDVIQDLLEEFHDGCVGQYLDGQVVFIEDC